MDWHEEIMESLKDYPNSFQLEEFVQPRRQRCADAIETCKVETFDSEFEEIRNENFLSLLIFKLGNGDFVAEALDMNEKAISKDPKNIVALANRVYLYKCKECDVDARKTLEMLEQIKISKEFSRRHDEALGEIAYSYTRMGPKFYHEAISTFKNVLERRPEEYLLKFGLALTYRRCLTQYIFSMTPTEDVGAVVTSAVNLLHDIVLDSTHPDLKAKAYIELGDFYKMMDDCRFPLNSALISTLKIKRMMDVAECYTMAYKTAGNNCFVLERSGKYFGNIRKHGLSEKLLKMAIEIRPESTFAYHHLAKLYMNMAQNDKAKRQHLRREAENCLKQSLKKSTSNTGAVYDLGRLYKSQYNYHEAIEQFRNLIQKGQPFASPLEKVNAYEQLGLMYKQMSRDKQLPRIQRNEFQTESEKLLTKAIEEAAKAVVSIPGLETSEVRKKWKALPTLEELLLLDSGERNSMETMMEVARLRKLMRRYKSSLDIYKRISFLGPDGSCNVGVMEGMIENYLKLPEFDNALHTLYLLQSSQEGHHGDRRQFDKDTFLACGMHFLKQRQMFKAGECFISSFRTMYPSSLTREYAFDIFILDDCEETQSRTEPDDREDTQKKATLNEREETQTETVLDNSEETQTKTVLDDREETQTKTVLFDREETQTKTVLYDREETETKTVLDDREETQIKTVLDDHEQMQTEAVPDKADTLKQLLDYCGLRVTRNDHAIVPGCLHLSGQLDVMEESKVIIIFLRKCVMSDELKYFCNIAISMFNDATGPRNIVVVKTYAGETPLLLRSFTAVEFRNLRGNHFDSDDIEWIDCLFQTLLKH